MQFTVPIFDPAHPIYYIKVFSDRWVCPEHCLPLSFKTLKLPSKFPAPT
jgi:pre-mRNA-splicing helicase BRR2